MALIPTALLVLRTAALGLALLVAGGMAFLYADLDATDAGLVALLVLTLLVFALLPRRLLRSATARSGVICLSVLALAAFTYSLHFAFGTSPIADWQLTAAQLLVLVVLAAMFAEAYAYGRRPAIAHQEGR